MKLRATHRRPSDSRDRRGSALIIIMLLLVILFLLGTALVGTTQEDRVSSYQNTENTQVDMYLDGVVNLAKATLVGDVFGSGSDRRKNEYRPIQWGLHYTSSVSNNRWLAARVPERRTDDLNSRNPGPYDKYNWPFISMPVHLNDEPQPGWWPFLSPYNARNGTYRINNNVMIQEVNGEDQPGLQYGNLDPVVSGDADGDGVADSGLWPLNKQPRNGIHYFAAMRIIDNAAGLNVNTAWRRDFDRDLSGSQIPNPAIVPSNVGLREAFPPNADYDADEEMEALNKYRMGGVSEPDMKPYLDDGRQRPDARWATHAEALYQSLGFRMGNPAPSGRNTYYRPLTSLDDTSLAYRFILGNPDAGPSPLEAALRNSLYSGAANYNDDPSRVWKEYRRQKSPGGAYRETITQLLDRWHENFDYEGGRYSMRPLLLTSNPTSQAVPVPRRNLDGDDVVDEPGNIGMLHYNTRGDWTSSPSPSYRLHDLVRFKGRYYAKISSSGNEEPTGNEMRNGTWEYQPWTEAPQKACLNTGSFRELWRAYWAAMVSTTGGSDNLPTSNRDPFYGLVRRSPVRSSATELKGEQVAQLRAALGAMNVMGMRNESLNVFSRTITLYEPPPSEDYRQRHNQLNRPQYIVTVFSNEQQPIISEVIVHKRLEGGDYIAVELHNPFPVEVQLRNYHLGRFKREGGGLMEIEKVAALSPGVLEMPKNGYVVFENSVEARPKDLDAAYQSRKVTPVLVQGLEKAIGSECVLLRPRRQGGSLQASISELDRYHEGSEQEPNLADWVPVDQLNFESSGPPGDLEKRFRYARDTVANNKSLSFYPGASRQPLVDVSLTDSGDLGTGGAASYTDTLPLKLHDPKWSVNRLGGSLHNTFPFGGFARAGEVVRVPVIGAYTIRPYIQSTGDAAQDATNRRKLYEMHSITTDIEFTRASSTAAWPPVPGRLLHPRTYPTALQPRMSTLVDFFTTRVAHHDYLPNVLPDEYGTYDDEGNLIRLDRPDPVANTDPSKANVGEPIVGVQGLVNINTAPWVVINQLPLWLNPDGTIDEENNKFLAKELARVNWNGRRPPFETLIGLNEQIWEVMSRAGRAQRPPPEEWEAYYAPMIRLSNLVGARSDSFTVYVLVEGWRDAYTPSARRVLQRRAAFMADRSNVTPTNRQMRIVNIPTN